MSKIGEIGLRAISNYERLGYIDSEKAIALRKEILELRQRYEDFQETQEQLKREINAVPSDDPFEHLTSLKAIGYA